MKIINIKEHKNGSATIIYTLNKYEHLLFQQLAKTRKKKLSKKFINSMILEAITNYLTKEN
jgi:hypothetical protein